VHLKKKKKERALNIVQCVTLSILYLGEKQNVFQFCKCTFLPGGVVAGDSNVCVKGTELQVKG